MKKLAGILVLLLFIPVSVDSQQPILVIELSSNGEATVTQLLSAKSIVSSISVPLISDRISKILATDERGILLKTTQNGNSLDIASLGASGVFLTYKADITTFDSQAWNVSYMAETETIVTLPPLATITSVSIIPIDIEENAMIMPAGPVSITYTISEVSSKTFFVLEAGQNYPVEITSASKIDDFFKQSNEIRFRISSSDTLLVVVPSIVLPNPIGASLNGGEVSFKPYYNNGTHNWIRMDPHEAGVIEIGGDVRASQIISDNPMTNEGSGENDSIFLTVGIILGVLAVGYVVFRKYFKIGLVRTSSSKGSNRSVKSRKHVKRNVKGSHIGIFALAFLPLLLTVPSAFADHDPALLISISDGLVDLEDLQIVSDGNGFSIEDFDVATLQYNQAMAALVDPDTHETAESLLVLAESTHDGIYDQLYLKIEEQQEVRHDEYVMNAKSSLSFIIENGLNLRLSEAVIDQLATTLAILESGTDGEIDAATGQIGITLSVLPSNLSLPSSFTTGSGFGEQLKSKLPPGIVKKYGYSTDSDIGTQSFDGANGNGEEKELGEIPPGFQMKFNDGVLPAGFQTKLDGIKALAIGGDAPEGLPDGFAKKYAEDGFNALPKGFLKKAVGDEEFYYLFESWSPDSAFEDLVGDDFNKDKKDKKDKKVKDDKKSKKVKDDKKDKKDKK